MTANLEVCSWMEGGTESEVPLGWWTGVTVGRKVHSDCSLSTDQDQKGGQAVWGAGWV